jgi:hypothetical protein
MSQPNPEQSAFENINVGGDFTVEGDVTQIGYQTVVQQKPDFFEPSLERYQSAHFKSPKIMSHLLARLKHQKFLVLAGSSDVDKDSLAKHTASCLIEELNLPRGEGIVKEWYRSSDPQSIEVELQKTEKATIFILTQVTPQNVGYDLERIQRSAVAGQHYIIVSTDVNFTVWRQPDRTKVLWYELSIKDVGDAPQLVNGLSQEDLLNEWYHQKLSPRERLLALGLSFFDGLFDDQFFTALEAIVEKVWQRRDASLRALDYCDLEKLHDFFSFTDTKDQTTKIAIRFPKQRRLLFKLAWKSDRRQILSALPVMVDLVKQSAIGRSDNPELYGSETKCREIRTAISETISDIGSISEHSIQTTLLQLSASTNTTVQATAAYAMARWREADYALDDQLFSTLHSWLDLIQARRIIDQVDAILRGRNSSNRETTKAEDYIKVTVALTVGYASFYDPPLGRFDSKGLSQELSSLLEKLAEDTSGVVRDAFLNLTLPKVLQNHLQQLSLWLHDIIQKQTSSSSSESSITNFNQAVGVSLAHAYVGEPKGTVALLQTWTDEGLRGVVENTDHSKISARESLLATVARTYGEIEYIQGSDRLPPEDVFECLHTILRKEKHPFVRAAIVSAIGRQARLYFDAIESQFQALVAEVKENEREDIVRTLGDIYLWQRINLSGGNYWSTRKSIKTGGRSYPYQYQIWIDEHRPYTAIEKAMDNWTENARNPVAQQIAMSSFVLFAGLLDQDEEQEKERILKNLDADTSPQNLEPRVVPTETPRDFYVKQIVPWLTISLKWVQYFVLKRVYYKAFALEWLQYKQIITGLLPEVIAQKSSSESAVTFVLERRFKNASRKKTNIIADLLKLAIGIAKNPGIVIFSGVLIVVFFYLLFVMLMF